MTVDPLTQGRWDTDPAAAAQLAAVQQAIPQVPVTPANLTRLAVDVSGMEKTLRENGYRHAPWTTLAITPTDPWICCRFVHRGPPTSDLTPRDLRTGSIIISQAQQPDGKQWLHASIDIVDGLPTYRDMVTLHRAVFGRRRYAFQVFAPDDKHVNLTGGACHLWGVVDGSNPFPDFARYGTI